MSFTHPIVIFAWILCIAEIYQTRHEHNEKLRYIDDLEKQTSQTMPCLDHTSILGLRWNMTRVPGSERQCNSQKDCFDKLCQVNSLPEVAWVVFRSVS